MFKTSKTSKTSKSSQSSKIHQPRGRFNIFALALALSVGTVGGLTAVAAQTGGGGGGNGGGAGGEPGGVMAITHANQPHQQQPGKRDACGGDRDTATTKHCRQSPRVVRIEGFANCAVIGQTRNGEVYCIRPM